MAAMEAGGAAVGQVALVGGIGVDAVEIPRPVRIGDEVIAIHELAGEIRVIRENARVHHGHDHVIAADR